MANMQQLMQCISLPDMINHAWLSGMC